MKRSTFLKALGLMGAAAVVPVDIIMAATPSTVSSPVKPSIQPPKFYLRTGDFIRFINGDEVRITMMAGEKVRLTPVHATVDIGNGCGANREYDKNDLPEIETFYRMFAGEGSRP